MKLDNIWDIDNWRPAIGDNPWSANLSEINKDAIAKLDAEGSDCPWVVANQWDESYIQGYREFAAEQAVALYASQQAFICEDFPIYLVMSYAKQHGLPFRLYVRSGETETAYDAATCETSTFDEFYNLVRDAAYAETLRDSRNSTHLLDYVDLGTTKTYNWDKITVGSLMFCISGNEAFHAQVIRKVERASDGSSELMRVDITQGNANSVSFFDWKQYEATTLEQGKWFLPADYYVNEDKNRDVQLFSEENAIEIRDWNFEGWN